MTSQKQANNLKPVTESLTESLTPLNAARPQPAGFELRGPRGLGPTPKGAERTHGIALAAD